MVVTPRCRLAILALGALLLTAPPAMADCGLRADGADTAVTSGAPGGDLGDAASASERASAFIACLGDPDPRIRDGIAFAGLSGMLREGQLTPEQLRSLWTRLGTGLQAQDPDGYRKPFVALALAEVARTDRIQPWMLPAERASMVEDASAYLASVRDYRGHVDGEGWRHGVAHGADWLMQLALNPNIDGAARTRLLAAIAQQVQPADGSSYRFGEPSRLARAAYFLLASGLVDEPAMHAWLDELVTRLGPMPEDTEQSAWWVHRNNLETFLNALVALSSQSSSTQASTLTQAIHKQLRQLP